MSDIELKNFQAEIKSKFGQFDKAVSKHKFMSILMEEVGEVARAMLQDDKEKLESEVVDLFFVTISVANKFNIDLGDALRSKILSGSADKLTQRWA